MSINNFDFPLSNMSSPPPPPPPQSTAPVDYPLVFKTPDGCGVGDCAIYVGIAVNEGNSDYLNFYIEGDAEAWVAVGVSATEDMVRDALYSDNVGQS